MEEESPMESPPAEERLDEMFSADDKLATENHTARAKEENKTSPNSPRRNGIPPKRPLATTKRTAASTPSSATKSTTASISRNSHGNGLSKPPTRPVATTTGRRPISTVTSATVSLPGHKSRASTSSVEDTRKAAAGSAEENKKPASSNAAKRASIAPTTPSTSSSLKPASSSLDRRSTLGGNASTDRKPFPASRTSASSPTKTALKPATNNARPTPVSSTPRNNRLATTSERAANRISALDPIKKRLSTIPASPAPGTSDATPPSQDAAPKSTPAKPVRPALGARKSTMSVTIEQRLREMELVNTMLQAAMAEDGDDNDEVKEEYGKQVDETLASLRTKLEEARRNEGKDVSDSGASHSGSGDLSRALHTSTAKTNQEDILQDSKEELQTALTSSQEEVLTLRNELQALQRKMLDFSQAAEDVSKDVQEATESIRQEHASKIDEMSAAHAGDLIALRDKLSETERMYKEHVEQSMEELEKARSDATNQRSEHATRHIEELKKAHEEALKALEDGLVSEKRSGVDAASRIEELLSEVHGLRSHLDDERRKAKEMAVHDKQQFDESLHERDQNIALKDKDIIDLQHELEELQATHDRELEEVESAASQRTSTLESDLAALQAQVRDLESNAGKSSLRNDEIVEAKDREISSLGEVIESLQDEVQKLQESKERELDAVKVRLIQEHEHMVSTLLAEHELATQPALDEEKKKVTALYLKHEQEIQDLLKEHESSCGELHTTIAELVASKTALQVLIDSTKAQHATELAELQSRLVTTENTSKAAQEMLEKALETATNEITSLKKVLETINQESKGKDDQHEAVLKNLKDDLEHTTRTLEEKLTAAGTLTASHTAELQQLRDGHTKALGELQHDYNTLLDTWKDAERNHPAAIEAVRVEYVKLLDDAAVELEEQRTRLERRHSQSRRDLEAQNTEKITKAEKKQLRDLNDMQEQHEKSYTALREDLEKKMKADLAAVHESHNTTLSDLQAQVIQHREALSRAETELQVMREAHTATHRNDQHESQLKELQSQLVQARAETIRAQEELENVRQRDNETIDNLTATIEEAGSVMLDTSEADRLREEMSELTRQHAAEISKIQETMSIENEKREKERKQGAEVRDRLSRELMEMESLRKELPAAKEEIEQHQQAVEAAKTEAQQVKADLAAAFAVIEDLKAIRQQDVTKLAKLQAEAAKSKAKQSKHKSTGTESSGYNQELEALQLIADTERQHNDKLKEQLQEARLVAEQHLTRTREVEAALKVTTAELTEMQTKRANGDAFAASPAPKGGLRTSRWAAEPQDGDDQEDVSPVAGEELGSVIEGTMASLQEQVRQLEGVNEDMLDETTRLVNMLSKMTTGSKTPANPFETISSPLPLPGNDEVAADT